MEQQATTLQIPPPPPRRSFGLLWACIAIAVLAVLMFTREDQHPGSGLGEQQAEDYEQWRLQQREFLDAHSLKDGVITRYSGLMIRHLDQGSGEQPDIGSVVTVHYEGRLVTGAIFDSSEQRGKPAVFPVAGLIPGWQEALQMMRVGGRAEVVIPADLAYGELTMGHGAIPAHSALVFELTLLSVD